MQSLSELFDLDQFTFASAEQSQQTGWYSRAVIKPTTCEKTCTREGAGKGQKCNILSVGQLEELAYIPQPKFSCTKLKRIFLVLPFQLRHIDSMKNTEWRAT